jgi:hypothetical protein
LLCWAATSLSYRTISCVTSWPSERRFRDEALTSAAQAATIILDGVKAIAGAFSSGRTLIRSTRWCASPERAYDITFFDEFARAAGGPSASSLENPESRSPS